MHELLYYLVDSPGILKPDLAYNSPQLTAPQKVKPHTPLAL